MVRPDGDGGVVAEENSREREGRVFCASQREREVGWGREKVPSGLHARGRGKARRDENERKWLLG